MTTRRPDKAPHPCPACGETVISKKFCDGRCRSRYNNGKRDYAGIKKAGMLPQVPLPKRDTRSWDERKQSILSRRDPATKEYRN